MGNCFAGPFKGEQLGVVAWGFARALFVVTGALFINTAIQKVSDRDSVPEVVEGATFLEHPFYNDTEVASEYECRTYGLNPSSILAIAVTVESVFSAVLSPLIGTISDVTPHRRLFFGVFATIGACSVLLQSLIAVEGMLLVVVALGVIEISSIEVASVMLQSYVPEVVSDKGEMNAMIARQHFNLFIGEIFVVVWVMGIGIAAGMGGDLAGALGKSVIGALSSGCGALCVVIYSYTKLENRSPARAEKRLSSFAYIRRVFHGAVQYSKVYYFLIFHTVNQSANKATVALATTVLSTQFLLSAQQISIAFAITIVTSIPVAWGFPKLADRFTLKQLLIITVVGWASSFGIFDTIMTTSSSAPRPPVCIRDAVLRARLSTVGPRTHGRMALIMPSTSTLSAHSETHASVGHRVRIGCCAVGDEVVLLGTNATAQNATIFELSDACAVGACEIKLRLGEDGAGVGDDTESNWFDARRVHKLGYACDVPFAPPASFCSSATTSSTSCSEEVLARSRIFDDAKALAHNKSASRTEVVREPPANARVVYIFGAFWGLLFGLNGSANWAIYANIIPAGREGEFYGMKTFFMHCGSWVAPFIFVTIVEITGRVNDAFHTLTGMHLLSLVVLFFFDEKGAMKSMSPTVSKRRSSKRILPVSAAHQ